MSNQKKLVNIIAILYILFISLFALDSVKQGILALIAHLTPSLFLLTSLLVSLKNKKAGGILFICLAMVFTAFFSTLNDPVVFLLISAPLFLIGMAYLHIALGDIKKLAIYAFVEILIISVLLFLASLVSIGYGVKYSCKKAQMFHTGDCVSALTEYAEREETQFLSLNNAIWALGQFGDDRALPVLIELRTSAECLEKKSCTYEADKAIKWCSSNKNLLSPIWRKLFL